jgi:hypothetical protein
MTFIWSARRRAAVFVAMRGCARNSDSTADSLPSPLRPQAHVADDRLARALRG